MATEILIGAPQRYKVPKNQNSVRLHLLLKRKKVCF